jgi:hypothetical protein
MPHYSFFLSLQFLFMAAFMFVQPGFYYIESLAGA